MNLNHTHTPIDELAGGASAEVSWPCGGIQALLPDALRAGTDGPGIGLDLAWIGLNGLWA
jgi:hypothetical protein